MDEILTIPWQCRLESAGNVTVRHAWRRLEEAALLKSQRGTLTPQMLQYDDFDDRAETRWLPYLMYLHRADYHCDVVNTDKVGFRISHGVGRTASAGGDVPAQPVRLLAGSSTAFGI